MLTIRNVAALAASLVAATANAQTVTFTNVIDSRGLLDTFSQPTINESGTLAFFARTDSGIGGIYTNDGTATTLVADDNTLRGSGGIIGGVSSLSTINDSGVVAFSAFRQGGTNGVYKWDAGVISVVADNINTNSGELELPSVGGINASGTVALTTNLKSGGVGVYTGTGDRTVTTIADTNTIEGGTYYDLDNAVINDSGTVVFMGSRSGSGGENSQRLFAASGGTVTSLIDSRTGNNGIFSGFNSFFRPSINASGKVAFHATLKGQGDAIFVTNGNDRATMIADTVTTNGGSLSSFNNGPAINSYGTVAFSADFDRTGSGIFVALTGFDLFQVVSEGDILFGSTVRTIDFWSNGLNDQNQLTFAYELSNGRKGIAVANIIVPVVPESSTFALTSIGLIASAFLLVKRRAMQTESHSYL